jgi:hypothetical protein
MVRGNAVLYCMMEWSDDGGDDEEKKKDTLFVIEKWKKECMNGHHERGDPYNPITCEKYVDQQTLAFLPELECPFVAPEIRQWQMFAGVSVIKSFAMETKDHIIVRVEEIDHKTLTHIYSMIDCYLE